MTRIEALLPQDFDLVAVWLSRPEINRWLTAEWRDRSVTPTLVAIAIRNSRNRWFLVRHDDCACGLVALADIDTADRTAMVWYVLGETTFSGRGITSEAVTRLARYAFAELELCSLYAWAMNDNIASRRVLQKVGFREVGRMRRAATSAGQQVDRIYFDLLPTDLQEFEP